MTNKTKPKLFIAITSQRFIFSRTAFCIINALSRQTDYDFAVHMEMSCDIASARNRIVSEARKAGATHLLFIDYDMYFSPDTIQKLIKQDKDIIGAAYNFRNESLKSTAVPFEKEEQVAPDQLPTETFKCQTLGTGLLLIKLSVFDAFKGPWFMFGYKEDGTLLYGEDTYFCQRAINEGKLDVWADPTLGVRHIGEQLF
jgi:hypothetical protein